MSNFNLLGVIMGLLSGLVYAGFTIASKKALFSFSHQVTAFYATFIASLVLFPFVIGADLSVGLHSWILLLILGVVNTAFAVTLYFKGIQQVKAQKGVVFTYLEPVSAVVFGFLFLAQQPTLLMLVGGALILIAGYIVVSR
jgi:drug/metabolite transporter (DMT)-like permease